ncbi:hypothetical protein L1987_02750 [Smallanthus sonchifolius]|uniref:Uncharacterized protein n=1 Tax=Smallanthus sonchifolius TaxID=185202 RepID=A0ACB9K8Q5_9ASTR|nr:hypothetical protein L1987_02750 [Smallanthus sonchifolius]
MFIWAIFQQWFHDQFRGHIEMYAHKLIGYVYPYVQINFHEYHAEYFERSKAYAAIERYLSANSSNRAKRLKANVVKDSESVVLSMDDYEEVTDEFNGVTIWWNSNKTVPDQRTLFSIRDDDERRFYRLTFHRKHRDFVTKVYLKHVLDEGKAIAVKTRQRQQQK